MSAAHLDPSDAELIVEARLGRPPQDALEAAVVLEAWAGVPAQRALATARALAPATPRGAQASAGPLPPRDTQRQGALQGAAFVLTVIAIACWAAPLASSLGSQVVADALMVALPLTIALQWALHSRYLNRPHAAAQLACHRGLLLAGAGAVIGIPAVAMGMAGVLAGMLTVTWTGGTILIARRWPLVYCATIAVATVAMVAGAHALAVLGAVGAATAVAVAAALGTCQAPGRPAPGRWDRAAVAAAIGTGLGLMLVLDRTVSFTDGAVPALALVPSTVASAWAAHRLRHLRQAIPRAVSGLPASSASRAAGAWPATRILAGSLGRLVALTATLSAALLALTPSLGDSGRGAGILVGFGLVALATLLVGLLESMGGGVVALTAVACAVAAEAIMGVGPRDPPAGTGLVVAGAVAIALALPALVGRLGRPARTLATAMWIP